MGLAAGIDPTSPELNGAISSRENPQGLEDELIEPDNLPIDGDIHRKTTLGRHTELFLPGGSVTSAEFWNIKGSFTATDKSQTWRVLLAPGRDFLRARRSSGTPSLPTGAGN